MRTTARRLGAALGGAVLAAVGLALSVVPGPLPVPFLLAALALWSTEFAVARRWQARIRPVLLASVVRARARPVLTAVVAAAWLALLAVAYLVLR